MQGILSFCGRWRVPIIIFITASFLGTTLPMAFTRPAGGDRIGQTAGVIRWYCQEQNTDDFWHGRQIHFGNNPFNLELNLFEWAQGRVARAIDPSCEIVEPLAKLVHILFGALAVFAVGFLASLLMQEILSRVARWFNPLPLWLTEESIKSASGVAAIIAALHLATDGLWLRYATLTMVEHRVLAIAALAMAAALSRRPVLTFILWLLVIVQKPQAFAFAASFWAGAELLLFVLEGRVGLRAHCKKSLSTYVSFLSVLVVGWFYFHFSSVMNTQSDLPWIQWMGPRSQKWFMGDWSDRFKFPFYKHLALDWFRRTALLWVMIPTFIALGRKKECARAFTIGALLGVPLLTALFGYLFIFYAVFIVHEYYALPVNLGRALATGMCAGFALTVIVSVRRRRADGAVAAFLSIVALIPALGMPAVRGLDHYLAFALDINNPRSVGYLADWNVKVFPEQNKELVVMAVPESGRELFMLYLTKRRGFAWCNRNPQFAPRKYWKEQGVAYVAWAEGKDAVTGATQWTVRTIEEELAYARAKPQWSSDVNDVWAGKSMSEWAALASRTFRDPCVNETDYDPRTWK